MIGDVRMPARIPIWSVVINMEGDRMAQFTYGIDRLVGEKFHFGKHELTRVFSVTGHQVWQGDVDRYTLCLYDRIFAP